MFGVVRETESIVTASCAFWGVRSRENRVRHTMLMARKRLHCWIAIKIQFKFRTRILITATERNYQDCYHSLLRLGIINRPRWGFRIVGKFSVAFFFHGGKFLFSVPQPTSKRPFFEREERTRKKCGSQKNGSNISLSSLLPPSQLSLCDYVMLSHENVKNWAKTEFPRWWCSRNE